MLIIDRLLSGNLFIYLFIFGCVGSSFLCEGFLYLWQAGATLHRGARAARHRGLSCCGAQAPDAQAQQLWLTGLAAPRHVGSSQTRAQTRVPCIGRQTLNHCATREAQKCVNVLNRATFFQKMHFIFASGTEMKRKFKQQTTLLFLLNNSKSYLGNFIGTSSNIDYSSDLPSHNNFNFAFGEN